MQITSIRFYHKPPSKQGQLYNGAAMVTSLQQLSCIIKSPDLTNSGAYQVKVAIPELPHFLNTKVELETNNYLRDCGCKQGMISGVVLLFLQFYFRAFGNWMFENTILNTIAIFLSGAVTGKLGTYAILRIRLAIALKRANNWISERTKI